MGVNRWSIHIIDRWDIDMNILKLIDEIADIKDISQEELEVLLTTDDADAIAYLKSVACEKAQAVYDK